MSDFEEFARQRAASIEELSRDHDLRRRAIDFVHDVGKRRYVYNFDWLGLPIIQFPQDIVAIQELIWRIKPRAIVETGPRLQVAAFMERPVRGRLLSARS